MQKAQCQVMVFCSVWGRVRKYKCVHFLENTYHKLHKALLQMLSALQNPYQLTLLWRKEQMANNEALN